MAKAGAEGTGFTYVEDVRSGGEETVDAWLTRGMENSMQKRGRWEGREGSMGQDGGPERAETRRMRGKSRKGEGVRDESEHRSGDEGGGRSGAGARGGGGGGGGEGRSCSGIEENMSKVVRAQRDRSKRKKFKMLL